MGPPSYMRSVIDRKVVMWHISGFGGLVVSMLAYGTRVRGFKPG